MLDGIISRSRENIQEEEGDYYEDGLLYCGKCHTKRQRYISYFGKKTIVGCLCECRTMQRELNERAEREEQARIYRMRIRSAAFADRAMMNWTFDVDDGANLEFSEFCKRYVEHFDELRSDGKGLLLYGGVGVGKTFMASCIANSLIDRGETCMVTNFARIANELQSDFSNRQERLDGLNRYSLLVIDDLFSERDTEYMNEIVMNVIDARYRVKKPLIVTTNLRGKDFTSEADIKRKRVFSRLYEMCIPYEVSGKDRRREILKSDMKKYDWLFDNNKGDKK